MSASTAEVLKRLAALDIPAAAMREVMSIIADMQSADDDRKRRDRERKRAKTGVSAEIPRNETGNSAEFPPIEPTPRACVLYGEELSIKELPTVVRKTDPTESEPEPDLLGSKPPNVTSLRLAKRAAEQRLLDSVGESWNAFAVECRGACAISVIPDGSKRERAILARSRDLVKNHDYPDAEAGWKAFFAKIRGSPFLRGEAPPGAGRERGFKPRLDAMIAPEFFLKIMEPDSPYGAEISVKPNGGFSARR